VTITAEVTYAHAFQTPLTSASSDIEYLARAVIRAAEVVGRMRLAMILRVHKESKVASIQNLKRSQKIYQFLFSMQ
jgi:hypothetical protein